MSYRRKCLYTADQHIPFQDNKQIAEFYEELDVEGPYDTVVFGGDLDDFYYDSDFIKDPTMVPKTWRSRVFPILEDLLTTTRELAPKAEIYWLEGNHEFWWVQKLWKHIHQFRDELLDIGVPKEKVENVTSEACKVNMPDLFPFVNDLNVTYIPGYGNGMMKLWDTGVILSHGSKQSLSQFSAMGIRKVVERFGVSCVVGHNHRNGEYMKTFGNGMTLVGREVGCMCDLNPAYVSMANWQHGMLRIVKDEKYGKVRMEPLWWV